MPDGQTPGEFVGQALCGCFGRGLNAIRAANLHRFAERAKKPERDTEQKAKYGGRPTVPGAAMSDLPHEYLETPVNGSPALRWPLRISIVAPSSEIVGGQSVQAASLIARLNQVPGIHVRLVPINVRLRKPFRWLRDIKYVRTIVNQSLYVASLFVHLRRADIVHVFSASYASFVLAPTPALLIARLYGKRVVLHYHSGEAEDHLKRWGRTALPTLRLADRILVPSRFLVEVFAKFGLQAQAIPNFVPHEQLVRRPRPNPAPVLLSNRNLYSLYNVACILRAFARIQARYPEASLVVAGGGSERSRLGRLVRELQLENVRFVGQIQPDEMPRLYHAADIYINASNIDNMPLSILESFAAGLPVVSTDAGGIPYFANHDEDALLTARDDDEGLAAAVLRLIEEPGLAERLTDRAYRVFCERYSWDAVADAWLGLYTELMSRPLRICLVAPSTRILGGQAVQAERLFRQLETADDVEVQLLPVNPQLSKPLRWLQRIKFVRTLVTEARYVWTLWFALRRADIAHIFSASYLSFVLAPTPALLIARLLGRRTILNYRSGEADDHLRRWKRTAVPTIRIADRIIVGSEYLIDVFERHGLEADAIPNIVEIDRYAFRERPNLRPVFLANRNFEAHYNVGDVLEAFAVIQREHPDARLTIAGDGPQRTALERLARDLELTEVTFLGQVQPDEMPRLYEQADIYINASLIDNMPTSLIEAFASGTPVVTSAAGGIPKIVDHERTGLIVPSKDFGALAQAALRLLREPDFALEMTYRARRECVDRYTWPVVRDQWLQAYRELTLGGLAPRRGQDLEARRLDEPLPVPAARS